MELASTSQATMLAARGPCRPLSVRRRLAYLTLANLLVLGLTAALAEVLLRWCWTPRYWVHAQTGLVGSGHGPAGKKWWPNSLYRLESPEFDVPFATNALGYRAHPGGMPADAVRIAFLGDSFTEAMQVATEDTFVSRLERSLNARGSAPAVRCENYGIAATGIFDYWHRLVHDVLRPSLEPPRAIVLCLYPGNDFTDACPADGFDVQGKPLRDYYAAAGLGWHIMTWLNTKSKLVHWVVQAVREARLRSAAVPARSPERTAWWTNPRLAAKQADAPQPRRIRALLRAIEAECAQRRVKLIVLVIGPAPSYRLQQGQSPLAQILADWGLRAPVIDVAATLAERPEREAYLFPRDGHLTPAGHAAVAEVAGAQLADALARAPADLR